MQTFDYAELPEIPGECGMVKESFSEGVGFARVVMTEGISTAHFHRKTIEYYVILEGEGLLKVSNGKDVTETELKPGVVVRIDVNEVHQTNNLGGLVLEAITTPAWTKEDEIISETNLF